MTEDISEEVKKEIFRLVCIPGIEIENIPEIVNKDYNTQLDYEKVMEILSNEYRCRF